MPLIADDELVISGVACLGNGISIDDRSKICYFRLTLNHLTKDNDDAIKLFLEGSMDKKVLLELTTDIVSAHASVNEMGREELLDELQAVFQKLLNLAGSEGGEGGEVSQELKPAVPVNKAFGADKVVCLVCGKGFTTLKKHISISHQMTPKVYRKTFGVPTKTPLVARNYSEAKKKVAQEKGLAAKLAEGRKKRAGK
jgi:predicted transcriptional regulator